INTGGTTVTPLQPQAQTSPLVLKKGEMRLERDRDEDEDEDEDKDEREDRLSLRGSFVVPPDSINPPAEGVTVTLVDGDGQIAEIRIPSGQGEEVGHPVTGRTRWPRSSRLFSHRTRL